MRLTEKCRTCSEQFSQSVNNFATAHQAVILAANYIDWRAKHEHGEDKVSKPTKRRTKE